MYTYIHVHIHQALDAAAQIRAEHTYLVGMTCSMGTHDDVSTELAEWSEKTGVRVTLAHDGMMLEFDQWSKSHGKVAGELQTEEGS
jgi:hypothetical protein